VKPIVQEFLKRIIHKAVTLDAIEFFKMTGGNDHPVMAVETQIIGTGMAGVLGTLGSKHLCKVATIRGCQEVSGGRVF